MKIDLPALNSITSSNIAYDSTYPKTYAGYSVWPEPISDPKFIEVNSPKKILMSNIVKPTSNAIKKLKHSVDLSITGKSKIFKNFTTIPTNKLNVDYSPLSLSTGLRHFIACNRPYWSNWELVIEPINLYYKFSPNQIALNVLSDLPGNNPKTWDEIDMPTYDKLRYFISREFLGLGVIDGYGKEISKITYRTTSDTKITMLMVLDAPCNTFYGVPETGYVGPFFSVAEKYFYAALSDQNKLIDLDNFLGTLAEKLFDRIEALDILIDPNNLGDLAMSFSSYGLTFTIQGYKSWPLGPWYNYGYDFTLHSPNFGATKLAFEMKIHGTAKVRDRYDNTTPQCEDGYVPISFDNLLAYIAVCFYIEDL